MEYLPPALTIEETPPPVNNYYQKDSYLPPIIITGRSLTFIRQRDNVAVIKSQERRKALMMDTLKKAVLMGAGLAVLTTEKMKEFFDEMVKKGELTEKEAREAFNEWREKSRQAKKDLETRIEGAVNKVMARANIPTRQELEELKERLAKLEGGQGQ